MIHGRRRPPRSPSPAIACARACLGTTVGYGYKEQSDLHAHRCTHACSECTCFASLLACRVVVPPLYRFSPSLSGRRQTHTHDSRPEQMPRPVGLHQIPAWLGDWRHNVAHNNPLTLTKTAGCLPANRMLLVVHLEIVITERNQINQHMTNDSTCRIYCTRNNSTDCSNSGLPSKADDFCRAAEAA